MGKENELMQLVKVEDVAGLTRLLHKFRANKPKLLGSAKRMNLNAVDVDGMCALHQTALLGNSTIMQLLLESGAYVDLKDNRGMRALHFAAWQGQAHLVSILLQWNSSVNEAANDGSTPLHLACQYGHLEVVQRLLCYYHANPSLRNKDNRTPFDLACEFGRIQIVELLLSSNKCASLLEESDEDTVDNNRTTSLHLAAKNGHLEIIRCLLSSGMDINRSTLRGTCLHEAALYGRFEVVKLLLESGVDVNKPNSYDQTALDIVKTMTSSSRAGRDIRQMLKEASNAVQAITVKDYLAPLPDTQALSLREGEYVTVLEQNEDGRWRGVVFGDNHTSRSGYFPSSAVALLNRQVGGGMQRCKPSQAKKVAPPVVPGGNDMSTTGTTGGRNSSSVTRNVTPLNNNSSSGSTENRDSCDNSMYITLPNGSCTSSPVHPYAASSYAAYTGAQLVAQVFGRGQVSSNPIGLSYSQPNSPREPSDDGSSSSSSFASYQGVGLYTQQQTQQQQHHHHHQQQQQHPQQQQLLPVYHQQTSLEDQGIDVQSPGRDSPGSSGSSSGSGCRHSITSLDSGRASSSAYDGRCGHVLLAGANQHRLSGHSYESSTSLRQSYHSSSSSLGSMDRLDENTPTTPNYSPAHLNVSKLLRDGMPEAEVLRRWLSEQRFEEYFHLFIQSGYDMPTISRMTPEDLTAIGITNPSHRKKLKVEIGKLNISDGLPDYIPSTLDEWLRLLRLDEYASCLQQQGYNRVADVQGIAWEDLEEIGIQRLGHQKKIMLAIKRLKDIQAGVKRFSTSNNGSDVSSNRPVQPLEVKCQVLSPPANNNNNGGLTPSFQPFVAPVDGLLQGGYLPGADDTYASFNGYSATMSPSHLIYRPDIVAIQVRHPSGARSLENLEDNRESRHQTFLQTDNCSTTTTNARWSTSSSTSATTSHHQQSPSQLQEVTAGSVWRRGSFDDGDLTPTNENVYEVEGGGTLPRPKVSIKPRPVAKIMAKTRLSNGGVVGDGGGGGVETMTRTDEDIMKLDELKSSVDNCVTVAEVHNSPRRSLPASPMNSVFRQSKKVPPPPPPKRTNSISEKSAGRADYSSEQLFASCVKSIASKFGLTRKSSGEWPGPGSSTANQQVTPSVCEKKLESPSSPSDEGSDLSLEISEAPDRTPPSPAPGSPVHQRGPHNGSRNRGSPFLSKRNVSSSSCESVASSNSSSSGGGADGGGGPGSSGGSTNTLPFANENVGTIKQRAIKPHPPLTKIELGPRGQNNTNTIARSAPATPKRRSSLKGCELAPNVVVTPPNNTLDTDEDRTRSSFGEGDCSGDVLSDIDHMLANLSSELDAMLTNELQTD